MVGTVTLSLEIELGWGYHDLDQENKYDKLSDHRAIETQYLRRLLDTCETLQIPISFNVVGHLLLEKCEGDHEGPHGSKWFSDDPGTDCSSDPLFYAPDMIEMIQDSTVNHEICTHTFSHILFDGVSENVVDWEFERVRELHRKHGLSDPKSVVPPRQQEPSDSDLQSHVFHTVRASIPGFQKPSSKFHSLVWILTRRHPIEAPTVENGIVKTYCAPHPSLSATHLQNGRKDPHPVFRLLPRRFRQEIQKRYMICGLRRAIKEDSYIHLWSHLHNIANKEQWSPLVSFLEILASARNQGDAVVQTMEELGHEQLDKSTGGAYH